MTTTANRTVIIPSWEGAKSYEPSYIVSLVGATEAINGCTHIKKNSFPANSEDYDVRCDSEGNLIGEYPLKNATKVYIWGYGYTLNGSYTECEPNFSGATEVKITENTEIILWGANNK